MIYLIILPINFLINNFFEDNNFNMDGENGFSKNKLINTIIILFIYYDQMCNNRLLVALRLK